MSCCAPGAELALHPTSPEALAEETRLASHVIGDGLRQTDLSVPGIFCGACIQKIETALNALPNVAQARVNLSTKRVAIRWRDDAPPAPFISTLNGIGYDAHLFEAGESDADKTLSELIRALAVAGFGASNVMLLSVSVWSGAEPATRDLFHWISALIAVPTVIYAGRVFFRSAWRALSHGQTNMDVPISIGVLLAVGLSLYETVHSGAHAYFDASVTLLFFLLIGRTLDYMMRERARTAVKGLAQLAARGALVLHDDGSRSYLPVNEINPGARILLAAGERVPLDARVISGQSELDCSLVSGESLPRAVGADAMLQAGTLNLTGPLTIIATAAAKDSFLAEMTRMMEAAEGGRSAYRRIADRAARLYAPMVHLTAFLTCIAWLFISGDLHRALTIAIATLIITCPCALGLAVPMVQVVAARRLFEAGIMVKDGTALERLAQTDCVVFDKTGTLTLGQPRLINADTIAPERLALAAALAQNSRHPYSRALAAAHHDDIPQISFDSIAEQPGLGLEARSGSHVFRLGRATWALTDPGTHAEGGGTVLARDGEMLAHFRFEDELRPDARAAIAELTATGFGVEILSGDRDSVVRELAGSLGVAATADMLPADKTARIAALTATGRKPLMVGDGLNDAPALAAAHASMAPASAADVGRNAADLVFLRDSLSAVPHAITVARRAGHLIRQNLGIAVVYNAIAVPIAVLGYVTPLVAAIAMSLSSIIVVGNALRLRGGNHRTPRRVALTRKQRTPASVQLTSSQATPLESPR